MSSTTVHSILDFPPEANLFVEIGGYVEEQENIEIPVGDGFINEANELITENGQKIEMRPISYKNIKENMAKREQQRNSNNKVEKAR